MQRPRPSTSLAPLRICLLLTLIHASQIRAQATPTAASAFDSYVVRVEAHLNQQHRLSRTFLVEARPSFRARLHAGELITEDLTPASGTNLPGALLHHWRGTVFIPGAHAADFTRLLKDINGYPTYFAPQVLQASILSRTGDHLLMKMRVRQQHILTVVLDATYAVAFDQLDSQSRYSASRSTRIAEIEYPGTSKERALSPQDEHGFLWRSNTYWTYQERDGGLYLQIESVSLSRSIPTGLGWAVRPFIQSVPRESLEFTLHSVVTALTKTAVNPAKGNTP